MKTGCDSYATVANIICRPKKGYPFKAAKKDRNQHKKDPFAAVDQNRKLVYTNSPTIPGLTQARYDVTQLGQVLKKENNCA